MSYTPYVVGFAFNESGKIVCLIEKNRPQWQAGKLNGVGGKIEHDESSGGAMVREFLEETGVLIEESQWKVFARMEFPEAVIFFYKAFVPSNMLAKVSTRTDEEVRLVTTSAAIMSALNGTAIPNLSWLIPLAAYQADDYEPIFVNAAIAEALT